MFQVMARCLRGSRLPTRAWMQSPPKWTHEAVVMTTKSTVVFEVSMQSWASINFPRIPIAACGISRMLPYRAKQNKTKNSAVSILETRYCETAANHRIILINTMLSTMAVPQRGCLRAHQSSSPSRQLHGSFTYDQPHGRRCSAFGRSGLLFIEWL